MRRAPGHICLPLAAALLLGCGGSAAPPPATSAAAVGAPSTGEKGATEAKLHAALVGAHRLDQEKKRDVHRHPAETLGFFGFREDMTVVELSPGEGWYTAILAPVLRDHGKLIVAGGDPHGDPASEGTKHAQALLDRFQKAPLAFDKVQSVILKGDPAAWSFGPAESADLVLTFRNFHNWVEDGTTDRILKAALAVLKHGGTLGLTDHRANPGASTDPKVIGDTGYIPQDEVVRLVEAAGFKLAGASEVNANPKDTKDYPKGVWTLPPVYILGEADHAKYEKIGESDRMTLRFVKP